MIQFFIYFFIRERERKRECTGSGEGAGGERENLKQAPYPAWSPIWGSVSQP